jgi:hypothetical protein
MPLNCWPAVLAASRLSNRFWHTSKTRYLKRPAETGGRSGASIAKFRTRRPGHICETSRYRTVFERPSYVRRWRRMGGRIRPCASRSMPDWAYRYGATQRVAADPVPKPQQLRHGLPTALKPAGCKFPDADVRIPPPQADSLSLTHTDGSCRVSE